MTLPLARISCATMLIGMLAAPARGDAPVGHYTASGGVVHDHKTGLNWQQVSPETTYQFADAVRYCGNNTPQLPGTGWRLPAVKELQTLLDDKVNASVTNPAVDTSANGFPPSPSTNKGGFYWSSTPLVGSTSMYWIVAFDFANTAPTDVTMTPYVRCVR